jgi:nucleoside permease NupC
MGQKRMRKDKFNSTVAVATMFFGSSDSISFLQEGWKTTMKDCIN